VTLGLIVVSPDQDQRRVRLLPEPNNTDPPGDGRGIVDFVQIPLTGKPADPFHSIETDRKPGEPLVKTPPMKRSRQGNRGHHRMRTSRSKNDISDSPSGSRLAPLKQERRVYSSLRHEP